ncbi:MAG: RNA polymerase sigma factor [Acidobacteriota bacterium]
MAFSAYPGMDEAGLAARVGVEEAERAAAEHRAADFRAFHERTSRGLWAYVVATCRDRALADDVVQESYLRLLQARGAPADEEGRRRYLFRIATNLLHDERRGAARHAVLEESELPPTAAVRPEDADVGRALRELEPRDRRLLWLAHVEGFSHREIAEATGVGEMSVRVLLFRARQRMAARLSGSGPASRPAKEE